MSITPIYLDYNATTPVDPLVFEEMKPFFLQKFGNASSKHIFGFEAEAAVKASRKQIADLINADLSEIYFTSGATESINTLHFGIAKTYSSKGKHIITTSIEHSAVLDSLRYLEQNGFEVTYLNVNRSGLIDLDDLERNIRKDTILVSVMAANNEIGIISDLKGIGAICSAKGVYLHTDASQAFGKIRLDVQDYEIDLMSFSGHKFYGPKGIGGFFMKRKIPAIRIAPSIYGGGQENRLRPGTLNVPGIVGIGKAAGICLQIMEQEAMSLCKLRDRLLQGLFENIEGVFVNGSLDSRLPNNINITINGVEADKLMIEARGIAFSSGSACSSGSDKPSHVLKAIGLSDSEARASIRLSIGRFTTNNDIDTAISYISDAVNKIRKLHLTTN